MDALAECHLRNGDVCSAATLYTSLAKLQPRKYARRVRLCRVLRDPVGVPLPHRHRDVCEALLEPAVSAELLLHDAHDAAAVHRGYQRLAVHVHPDKNPQPRATEAFQRLTALKEQALQLLEQRLRERAAADEQQQQQQHRQLQTTTAAMGTRPDSRRRAAATAVSSSSAAAAAAAAAAVAPATATRTAVTTTAAAMPDWAAMKQTRITLCSLHRRDIDDNFTIFASASRQLRRTDDDVYLLDDDEDDDEDDNKKKEGGSSSSSEAWVSDGGDHKPHSIVHNEDNDDNSSHDEARLAATVPQVTRRTACVGGGRGDKATTSSSRPTATTTTSSLAATTTCATTQSSPQPPQPQRAPVPLPRHRRQPPPPHAVVAARQRQLRASSHKRNNSSNRGTNDVTAQLHVHNCSNEASVRAQQGRSDTIHNAASCVEQATHVSRSSSNSSGSSSAVVATASVATAVAEDTAAPTMTHVCDVRTRIDGLLDQLAQLRERCTHVRLTLAQRGDTHDTPLPSASSHNSGDDADDAASCAM